MEICISHLLLHEFIFKRSWVIYLNINSSPWRCLLIIPNIFNNKFLMCFPLSSISNYILEPNSLKLMNVPPSVMIPCCCCLATDCIPYKLYLLSYDICCYSLKQFCLIDEVLSLLCRWTALPFPIPLSDWPIPTGLQHFYNPDNNQSLFLILWILLMKECILFFRA